METITHDIILSNSKSINDIIFFSNCDSGFFSNCNIILSNIIMYFNIKKKLPINIEVSNMFRIYRSHLNENIYDFIFDTENTNNILYEKTSQCCEVLFLVEKTRNRPGCTIQKTTIIRLQV